MILLAFQTKPKRRKKNEKRRIDPAEEMATTAIMTMMTIRKVNQEVVAKRVPTKVRLERRKRRDLNLNLPLLMKEHH